MADAGKSKEELEREWWARWRAWDYSWEGLARKSWAGQSIKDGVTLDSELAPADARRATLQDYWREEEAHLIAGDGMLWTRAHCPLVWADGTPTPKATWTEAEKATLVALLSRKLAEAGETEFEGPIHSREFAGADRRAQFQGCVLFSVPVQEALQPLSACFIFAFVEDANFGKSVWFEGADFSFAFLSGNVNFHGAKFSGAASFETVTFAEYAHFLGAAFAGGANFIHAKFLEGASFGEVAFSSNAIFDEATFTYDAELRASTFHADAMFERATFSADAEFGGAVFSQDARFISTEFARAAEFSGATFAKRAHFVNCAFFEIARFVRARFGGDLEFTASVFEKLATFDGMSWPATARDWHAAFDQTLFRGTAIFVGAGFKALAAFDGATFERGLQIDDTSEDTAKHVFLRERAAAISSAPMDAQAWAAEKGATGIERTKPVPSGEIAVKQREFRDARLKQLERGCRVLKQAMEYASNKTREQMLYRFELLARRAQRDTPAWEKMFSYLYDWSSDYGASMARPFVALAAVLVAFTAIFYSAGLFFHLGSGVPLTDAWQALDFSMANAFKPLSALSVDPAAENTLGKALLSRTGPGWHSAVLLAAIVESFAAIVLAFLFALAVRRRFQIS